MGTLEQNRFKVRKARAGFGLFAAAPFSRGEFVIEYTGPTISNSFANTLKTRYLFEIDDSWSVDGSPRYNLARYMNHSCAPNCEADIQGGRVFLYARRDIRADEELTFDYGDEYFNDFIRPVGCRCASCDRY